MTDVQQESQESQRRSSSRNDADEVVEYLQLAGQRYREHVALLREEAAVRAAQHAPFKPTITTYAEQASKSSVVRQGTSIGERLHELHERQVAVLAEATAEEASRREAEAQAACPFAPTVTTRAARLDRSEGDVSASLLQWDAQRRARRVRQQVAATRQEISTVTAVPRVSAYAAEKARTETDRRCVPIEVSLLAEGEARRRRQHAAVERRYAASSSTATATAGRFSPSVSPYAAQLHFDAGVVDRLYPGGAAAASGDRVYDEEAALHCTFRPQLSPQSTALSQRYYAEEGEAAADPHDRLYRNAHHASKYRKSVLPDDGGGKPEINDTSRRLVEERRRQLVEAGEPGALGNSPGSRLYAAATAPPPSQRQRPTFKKRVVTARDVELQTALTFAPAVSPTSDALWRRRVAALKATGVARNTEEARMLLWRKAEKKAAEEAAQLQAQRRREEAAACTFHPHAGRPPHRRSGYLAMPIEARTAMWARQRAARAAELRDEAAATATAVCTFRPSVDPVFPLPRTDAALATGVEAFVERQAAARRQRAEAQAWWRLQHTRRATTSRRAASSDASLARIETTASTARSTHRREDTGTDAAGGAASAADTDTETEEVAGAEDKEEEEVFVQHWARQPPSTSLTASSFSHTSQPEVPSAESSPRQLAYVVQQPPATAAAAASARGGDTPDASTGPYRWQWSSSNDSGNRSAATSAGTPSWRKPLRYRTR